jgi:hypothetical protein
MMIVQTSNRRRRFSASLSSQIAKAICSIKVDICNRFTFALFDRFVFDLHSLCRVRIVEWSVQTSKRLSLFVKWSQNDHVFSNRTFWIFLYSWDFFILYHFVHAKVTLSDDRRYYREHDDDQRMMWLFNFRSQSKYVLILSDFITCFLRALNDHHFSIVSLKLLCDVSVKAVCSERIHAFLRMLCLLLSIVFHQCLFRRVDVVVACLNFVEMFEL